MIYLILKDKQKIINELKKDEYWFSRYYEWLAREQEKKDGLFAAKLWIKFAKLKISKGSFFLGSYGLSQAGRIYENNNRPIEAARLYAKAAKLAKEKVGDLLLVALWLSDSARCCLNCGRNKEAFKYYKDLGDLFRSAEKYFMAADFYEHAAEIMIKEGMNPSKHVNPKEMWITNAKYFEEKGEIDDIEWSLKRASKYTELINEFVELKRQKVHKRYNKT